MKQYILSLFSFLIFADLSASRFSRNQINDAIKIVKKIMDKNTCSSCVKNQVELISKLFNVTADLNTFEVMLQNISIVDELGEPQNIGVQILDFASCITPQAPVLADEAKPSEKSKAKEGAKDSAKEKTSQKNSKNNDSLTA